MFRVLALRGLNWSPLSAELKSGWSSPCLSCLWALLLTMAARATGTARWSHWMLFQPIIQDRTPTKKLSVCRECLCVCACVCLSNLHLPRQFQDHHTDIMTNGSLGCNYGPVYRSLHNQSELRSWGTWRDGQSHMRAHTYAQICVIYPHNIHIHIIWWFIFFKRRQRAENTTASSSLRRSKKEDCAQHSKKITYWTAHCWPSSERIDPQSSPPEYNVTIKGKWDLSSIKPGSPEDNRIKKRKGGLLSNVFYVF